MRRDPRQQIRLNLVLKMPETRRKVRRRFEGDWTTALDQIHNLYERPTRENHQKKGTCRGGSLHTRVTVDQHMMSLIEFTEDFIGDFGGPGSHVVNFCRLEIVIDGYTILIGNRWMKW